LFYYYYFLIIFFSPNPNPVQLHADTAKSERNSLQSQSKMPKFSGFLTNPNPNSVL